jgi:hypothetical protein
MTVQVDIDKDLQRYSFLIADPLRTEEEDKEMKDIRERLKAAGIDPKWEPIPRIEDLYD